MAELAAFMATAVALIAAFPQLRRVIVHGDGRGVSLTSAMLGIGTELAWLGYAVQAGLWSALPEAVLMGVSNAVLAVALAHWGAITTRAVPVGMAWIAVLGAVATMGGFGVLAIVLAGAYAVQVAPAVWTVWRTPSPTGVASTTWAMVGVEGMLWGVYGLHHGDPAIAGFAVIAIVAATATLARTAASRRPVLPANA